MNNIIKHEKGRTCHICYGHIHNRKDDNWGSWKHHKDCPKRKPKRGKKK